MDIDIWEVIEAAKTKPFGFMPFYPGPGLGGHCIPLDPFYLSWKAKAYDFSTRFIELAGQVNDEMPHHVVERSMMLLNESGKSVRGAKILVLGVAYKRDIDDTRESPALKVISQLSHLGADVSYHDPYVGSVAVDGREYASQPLDDALVRESDLVLILTGHTKVDYARVVRLAPLVFDTRNATAGIAAPTVTRLGVGR
jgi:UDP-N-acetyl-D-glucosamine dehydrogenase